MDYEKKFCSRIFCSRFYFSSILLLFISLSQGIAQESPHKQENLNCETCHVSTSWSQIRFNHDVTKFPLVDRHQEEDCTSCHNIEDFRTTSSDCFTCHEDVHQAKMGGDCERCHSFKGWEIFNVEEIHANTQFPMMGRHTLVDCQSCHQNQQQGDFALLTTDCVSCHQQSYLATENPNHVANSFSTNCQECHGMDDWQPAFLPNHDVFFPIFSGEHDGAWSDCVVCHQNPATFTDFTCLTCHEHQQPKMDEEHQGIAGYAYESNACFSCHPTGEKGEFTQHDNLFFPIFTGNHAGAWEGCFTCHPNPTNRKEFTCVVCHEHRQSEMDLKHQGFPDYTFESSACLLCHPDGVDPLPGGHNPLFPISSGPHRRDCVDCHIEPGNFQRFECIQCHEHRQQKMDDKHLGKVRGYVWESNACLNCHPNGKS